VYVSASLAKPDLGLSCSEPQQGGDYFPTPLLTGRRGNAREDGAFQNKRLGSKPDPGAG
jgi:hypothetical protein